LGFVDVYNKKKTISEMTGLIKDEGRTDYSDENGNCGPEKGL